MRLGWSVLCRGFEQHDDGMITLQNVFAEAKIAITPPIPYPREVALNPAVILISYWFTESDLDKLRYPAVLRVLAPEDNQILTEWNFAIDFMYGRSSLTVFYFHELTFVGAGLYEFHIEVPQFGEWNIMTQNSLFLGD